MKIQMDPVGSFKMETAYQFASSVVGYAAVSAGSGLHLQMESLLFLYNNASLKRTWLDYFTSVFVDN